MSMITVTMNPAIDQTVTLDQLKVGEVHRAKSVHYHTGGKGIMVASCLADWHDDPIVVTGLLGKDNAGVFKSAFQQKAIEDQFIEVDGINRTNIKIVDKEATTDLNLPGISSTDSALSAVLKVLDQPYEIAILSGSLPSNCEDDAYVKMLDILQAHNTKVIVDASGEALKTTLSAKIKPYCIKPNIDELSEYLERPLGSIQEIITEARALLSTGIQLIVISMGSDGALFIDHENVLKASLKAPKVLTTVGAGDAMVAGIASAIRENADLERIARLSTAFSVAKLGFIEPHLPGKTVVEDFASQVNIKKLEG